MSVIGILNNSVRQFYEDYNYCFIFLSLHGKRMFPQGGNFGDSALGSWKLASDMQENLGI